MSPGNHRMGGDRPPPRTLPAFVPDPPTHASRGRTALAVCGTLALSWFIAVGVIWAGCLVSGACQ